MNIRRLNALANAYEKGKINLIPDMRDGIYKSACGTAGCIAGEAAVRFAKIETRLTFVGDYEPWINVASKACDALDVYGHKSDRLFLMDNWPNDLRLAYSIAASNSDEPAMRAVMAARIRRFVATKGEE